MKSNGYIIIETPLCYKVVSCLDYSTVHRFSTLCAAADWIGLTNCYVLVELRKMIYRTNIIF